MAKGPVELELERIAANIKIIDRMLPYGSGTKLDTSIGTQDTMNKDLKALLSDLPAQKYKEVIDFCKSTRIEKRAAVKERKAALKAELAEMTEFRTAKDSDEKPAKKRKNKKNKRAE